MDKNPKTMIDEIEEKCGCDIRSGRWCPDCAEQLSADLKGCYVGVGDKPKKNTAGKMRFLDKRG